MRPNAFSYSRPATIAQVLAAMQQGAVPLAGGQSLLQAMRLRQAAPARLVDLAAAGDLAAEVVLRDDALVIGARVTHAAFAADARVAREFPWLAQAARALGDVQVRNRGTVVGNVCWADPRANFTVAMLASDAKIHYRTPRLPAQPCSLPIEDFLTGFRQHAVPGALVTHLEVPRAPPRRGVYREFSRQRQDLALVNVCVVRGAADARVVVGGIHQTPVRVPALERLFSSALPPAAALSERISAALGALTLAPLNDPYGSPAYKLILAGVEVRRAIASLREEAGDG